MEMESNRAIPGLKLLHQGKVRNTYEIPGYPTLILVIATDRLSTHNVVHKSVVYRKGELLTAITLYWHLQFKAFDALDHIVAYGGDIYQYLPVNIPSSLKLHLRAMVVQKLDMIPFEFIYRARLDGSLWKAYVAGEDPYQLRLPSEMQRMQELPGGPIFTPTEKSDNDDPVTPDSVKQKHREAFRTGDFLYAKARAVTQKVGIEMIDTKLEFGINQAGKVVLADEFFTPDSSRFTLSGDIHIGDAPVSLDKQLARDEAEQIWEGGKKTPLTFSREVIIGTSGAYRRILRSLSGFELEAFQDAYLKV